MEVWFSIVRNRGREAKTRADEEILPTPTAAIVINRYEKSFSSGCRTSIATLSHPFGVRQRNLAKTYPSWRRLCRDKVGQKDIFSFRPRRGDI